MHNHRQEIIEFDAELARMQERLATRNVVIRKKDYAPQAFGSWQIMAGTAEKKFDFTYDGKDAWLTYHDMAVVPKEYSDVQQRRFRTWEGENPLEYVEEILMKEFPEPETMA